MASSLILNCNFGVDEAPDCSVSCLKCAPPNWSSQGCRGWDRSLVFPLSGKPEHASVLSASSALPHPDTCKLLPERKCETELIKCNVMVILQITAICHLQIKNKKKKRQNTRNCPNLLVNKNKNYLHEHIPACFSLRFPCGESSQCFIGACLYAKCCIFLTKLQKALIS